VRALLLLQLPQAFIAPVRPCRRYRRRWWAKGDPTPGPEELHKRAVSEIETFKACETAHGLVRGRPARALRLAHLAGRMSASSA
jgi:hypothetical protein